MLLTRYSCYSFSPYKIKDVDVILFHLSNQELVIVSLITFKVTCENERLYMISFDVIQILVTVTIGAALMFALLYHFFNLEEADE